MLVPPVPVVIFTVPDFAVENIGTLPVGLIRLELLKDQLMIELLAPLLILRPLKPQSGVGLITDVPFPAVIDNLPIPRAEIHSNCIVSTRRCDVRCTRKDQAGPVMGEDKHGRKIEVVKRVGNISAGPERRDRYVPCERNIVTGNRSEV